MSALAPHTVTLPEDSMSTDLDALKQALLGALDSGQPVVVVGSEVSRAGTAVLQLLLAFVRQIADRGGSVELREPSKPLSDALATLGLWEHPAFLRLR